MIIELLVDEVFKNTNFSSSMATNRGERLLKNGLRKRLMRRPRLRTQREQPVD